MYWGYVFLAAALLCGLIKGFCGKMMSGQVSKYQDAMLVNSIRMVLCVFVGIAVILFSHNTAQLYVKPVTLWIALLSGAANAVNVITWVIAVKTGAYMLTDVFAMLGVCVPVAGCAMLFGETIKLTQIAGIVLLFISVLIMCSYNNSIKPVPLDAKKITTLTACGLASGFSNLSQKLFVNYSGGTDIAVFNFYTYVFAAAILFVMCITLKAKGEKTTVKLKNVMGYVIIMAVMLFLFSYFMTLTASKLSSVLIYPLSQGGSLILGTAMSAFLFKEKFTAKSGAGIALSFAALVVINCL